MKTIMSLLLSMIYLVAVYSQADELPEQQIQNAFAKSMQVKSSQLDPIIKTWEQEADPQKAYWLAYAYQQNAIVQMSIDNEKDAESAVVRAIELLESKDNMDSEDHALLGSLYSLSIAFAPIKAMSMSRKAGKQFTKALEKDDQNIRAYLGQAKSDFYTPKMFGGGKQCEALFQKALSLPAKSQTDAYAPSWGRDDAYFFLIQYYQQEERDGEAQLMIKKALEEFPHHGGIKQLQEKA